MWIGWFGFNGGSALGANLRAVSACISTHLAACAGGVTGTFIEYIAASRTKEDVGRSSVIGFCNGAVAGLVAITPAAGYVSFLFPSTVLDLADKIGAVLVSSCLRNRGQLLCFCVRGY